MNKLKIGIIGFGRMGITHLSIINSHPRVQIVAVVDTSDIILSLLNKYLVGIQTYNDYLVMFHKESLDAIIICTPPSMHYSISKEAAKNNVHVFCEKPFTNKYSLGLELSNLFKKSQLVNQVGYVNRFNDIFRKTKEIVDDGIIGDVIRFKSEMYSRTITKNDESKTWRDSRDNGGGAIYEVASHAIDLINFLVGKPHKIVGTSLNFIFSNNVEDAVSSTFLYKNNISGTLNVNWSDESYRKPTNKIELFGRKGKILADQHGLKIFLKEFNPKYNLRSGWNTLYITDLFQPVPFYVRGNEFTTQLYHFIDCILDNKKVNNCNFEDASNTLEIIDQMFNDYQDNIKNM
jgi:scyllo-inositol 2-dehydrogenase (NADP+)